MLRLTLTVADDETANWVRARLIELEACTIRVDDLTITAQLSAEATANWQLNWLLNTFHLVNTILSCKVER